LANAAVSGVPPGVKQYFPAIAISPQSYLAAAIIIVALGAISAILPCYQAGRLKIVDALRKA
jgi:ABC-type antimicrobial peptide transport system permease subunit